MKIVILDGHPLNPGDISWEPLAKFGELSIHQKTPENQIAQRISGADIVLTNKTPIGARELPALKNCKMIGVLATGINVIDAEAISKAGITLCNVPAYGAEDVAQHALALLLELARGTALHSGSVKRGEWSNKGWCYWQQTPLSLSGLCMGIIGFGSIGQAMGRYANALGMTVLACSPRRKNSVSYPFSYAGLDEIWASADVISLHCPLTDATFRIINQTTLNAMKNGAILINTARGDLVDEQAVAEALRSGKLAAFGADVLSREPPEPDNQLLALPNTLITPHMAWATARARQNIVDIMAENIRAYIEGKPINTVNV